MKVLYCEQCDEMITEDDFGLEFEGSYFCSDTCLYAYVDMMSDPIPKKDFELYGTDEDEDENEEDTDDETEGD